MYSSFSFMMRWISLGVFVVAWFSLMRLPSMTAAIDYFLDLACVTYWWREYIVTTYRYGLEIHCNDGAVVERKFLSLPERNRIVGALVEAGGYKMED